MREFWRKVKKEVVHSWPCLILLLFHHIQYCLASTGLAHASSTPASPSSLLLLNPASHSHTCSMVSSTSSHIRHFPSSCSPILTLYPPPQLQRMPTPESCHAYCVLSAPLLLHLPALLTPLHPVYSSHPLILPLPPILQPSNPPLHNNYYNLYIRKLCKYMCTNNII